MAKTTTVFLLRRQVRTLKDQNKRMAAQLLQGFRKRDVAQKDRRILACYVACQGIPTEALELGVIEEVMAVVGMLKDIRKLAEGAGS